MSDTSFAPVGTVAPPMTVAQSTPAIDAAMATVATLQDQLDNKLVQQIEAAIHAGDSAQVRTLRDKRTDVASQLYAAKVQQKQLEIAYATQMEVACGTDATRLSNAAQTKLKERQAIDAESEAMNQAASSMNELRERFRGRGDRATQHLAEIQQAETMRLRALAQLA